MLDAGLFDPCPHPVSARMGAAAHGLPGLDQSRGQVFQIPVCGRPGPSFETLLAQLLRMSRTTAADEIAAPSVLLAFGVSVRTEPSLPDAGSR